MKNILKMKLILTGLLFLTLAIAASAQPAPPANPVPLDGGIGLLIAAGAAFGIKKYKDNRKID